MATNLDQKILLEVLQPLYCAALDLDFFEDKGYTEVPVRISVDGFGTVCAEMYAHAAYITSTYPDKVAVVPQENYTSVEAFRCDPNIGLIDLEDIDPFEFAEDIFEYKEECKQAFQKAAEMYNEKKGNNDYPFDQVDFDELRLDFVSDTSEAWARLWGWQTHIFNDENQLLYLRTQEGYAVINDAHWLVMKKQANKDCRFAIPLWVYNAIRPEEDYRNEVICFRYNKALTNVTSYFKNILVEYQCLNPWKKINYGSLRKDFLEDRVATVSGIAAYQVKRHLKRGLQTVTLKPCDNNLCMIFEDKQFTIPAEIDNDFSITLSCFCLNRLLDNFAGSIKIAIAPDRIRITNDQGDLAFLAALDSRKVEGQQQ